MAATIMNLPDTGKHGEKKEDDTVPKQKIYKVFWRNIPDPKSGNTWHDHFLGTYVISQNQELPLPKIHSIATQQIIDSLHKKKDWMECRVPFTYFNPEDPEEKSMTERWNPKAKAISLKEYLINTTPDIKEVSSIAIISSSLDG